MHDMLPFLVRIGNWTMASAVSAKEEVRPQVLGARKKVMRRAKRKSWSLLSLIIEFSRSTRWRELGTLLSRQRYIFRCDQIASKP